MDVNVECVYWGLSFYLNKMRDYRGHTDLLASSRYSDDVWVYARC